MQANDLRTRADALRSRVPARRSADPPPETGERLATLKRPKDRAEIRINWCEYEGHPYLGIRVWSEGDDGRMWPRKDAGFSIRLRELPDVAGAIATALDRAEQVVSSPRPSAIRQLEDERRTSAPTRRDFDEFR